MIKRNLRFKDDFDFALGLPNGWRYWQVRELAGKITSRESAVGAESPKVWATPALVQCTRCWALLPFTITPLDLIFAFCF
jgi:hypothetical protein